jgi:hypothetical protein
MLRQRYVDAKIAFWKAVKSGEPKQIEAMRQQANAIARALKLPKALSKSEVNSA